MLVKVAGYTHIRYSVTLMDISAPHVYIYHVLTQCLLYPLIHALCRLITLWQQILVTFGGIIMTFRYCCDIVDLVT